MQQLEGSIAHHRDDPDRADRQPTEVPAVRVARPKDKLARVRAQARKPAGIGNRLLAGAERQVLLSDTAARTMAASGRGTGIVVHIVQTTVDS